MGGVERARARVRELTPLLFNFDFPIMPSFQVRSFSDPCSYSIRIFIFSLLLTPTAPT